MFEEHPTWRMLEQTKGYLQELLTDVYKSMKDLPHSMQPEVEDLFGQIKDNHARIVKMQLRLENKLCQSN